MKVKDLKYWLRNANPEATVLLRDSSDLAEAELSAVEYDPATEEKDSEIVMLWGNFETNQSLEVLMTDEHKQMVKKINEL